MDDSGKGGPWDTRYNEIIESVSDLSDYELFHKIVESRAWENIRQNMILAVADEEYWSTK